MTAPERWLPVCGSEDRYAVSSWGRVKRLARVTMKRDQFGRLQPHRLQERVLVSSLREGYPAVAIWDGQKAVTTSVHRLVARAFLGEPREGQMVLHGDGDRKNPCLDNLRYGSSFDNAADAAKHGTVARGERAGTAKLTAQKVAILKGLKGSVSAKDIGAALGVSHMTVYGIWHGRDWKHVEGLSQGEALARFKDAYETAAAHYAAYQGVTASNDEGGVNQASLRDDAA